LLYISRRSKKDFREYILEDQKKILQKYIAKNYRTSIRKLEILMTKKRKGEKMSELLFNISILFIIMGVFTLPIALMERNKTINKFIKKLADKYF